MQLFHTLTPIGTVVERQENFRTGHASLLGVIINLAVIFAEQILPRAAGDGDDSELFCATLNLCCMKMVERDGQSPPGCSATLCALTASITMP